MKKFASMVLVALSCVGVSAFAQEAGEEIVVNTEVSVGGGSDDVEFSGSDVPEHSETAGCGCGEKPKN